MQPTLAITASAPGLLSVNGRFFGEIAPDAPLFVPVCHRGAVYLDFRPLQPGWMPLTRKLVMSSGLPLADSLPAEFFAVCWPGGVIELEMAPEPIVRATVETITVSGHTVRIHRGHDSFLENGVLRCPFPSDGSTPQAIPFAGGIALSGTAGAEHYLLTLSGDMTRQTGFLRADSIDLEPPDSIRALTRKNDIAGHAVLERWQSDPAGLRLISSDPVWEGGCPRVPRSPEETVCAAFEAALLGFSDEADSYLAPALRARFSADILRELCDLCLPMKFVSPGNRSCVGLLRIESGSLASVRPLYYQAEYSAGQWLVTSLAPETPDP